MNNGKYLYDSSDNAKSDFCIGVAAYPEKHFEAPNLKTDLAFVKKKIEIGAEYIVTQMFFDNQKYFEFVDLCRKEGINVPIIPGLKPNTTKKQLTILPSIFHIDLPEALADDLLKCKNNDEVKQVGIEWCIQQSKELKAAGVPILHYYTMGKSETTYKIAKEIF
jgi:methylenetetrahydrofolate reductase (NADPH)